MPESNVFHGIRPSAWLRITGEDALGFLQGQFSQDLKTVPAGAAAYGFWLDHKGRVEGDSFVIRSRDRAEYSVCSLDCPAEAIRARLEKYIVADDVLVEDRTDDWRLALVLGGQLGGIASDSSYRFAGRPPGSLTGADSAEPGAAPGRGDLAGLAEAGETVVAAPRGDWESLRGRLAASGLRELAADAWERARILAGIASVPADLGPGDLPQEAGLAVAAVSYAKGCFVGQEVMSRLKSRGRVRRRLRRVRWSGPLPETLPAPVYRAGRAVGQIRSAATEGAPDRRVGLAMLPADLAAAPGLSFSPDGSMPLGVV